MDKPTQTKVVSLSKKLKAINPKKDELTVETLRQFQGMENLAEDQAIRIIASINTLSSILYEVSKKIPGIGTQIVDNQQFNENNSNLAA